LAEPISNEQLAELSAAATVQVEDRFPLFDGAHVIMSAKFINDVQRFNDIEYIEEDKIVELDYNKKDELL
jgi:hypothetical protein